ncbi:MAG TPA: TIR domain-containing protein [Thermoanaerobaculia bacterium]|nr:TIR domain-containing protein [Thermoanaerobaculia bacterium]
MPVRIFISHSTTPRAGLDPQQAAEVEAQAQFRRDLYARLQQEADFDVYLDREVPAGEPWRERVKRELRECDAAVLLANRQALRDSEWVETEATILGFRAGTEPENFRLIVVPFGGVTRSDLESERLLRTVALTDLQLTGDGTTLDVRNPDAVRRTFDQIVAGLRAVDDPCAREHWMVAAVSHLLPDDEVEVRDIARQLGCSLPRFGSKRVKRCILAKHVYEAGPRALEIFFGLLWSSSQLGQLLELLRTYWIDPRASGSIARFATPDLAPAIFAINARRWDFTPAAYVDHGLPPPPARRVFAVDGTDGVANVLEGLRQAFVDKYRSRFDRDFPRGTASPAEIDGWINRRLTSGLASHSPLFVTLSDADASDPQVIAAIQGKYPLLRVVLCTESPAADVKMLEPRLDPDIEAAAAAAYDELQRRLEDL